MDSFHVGNFQQTSRGYQRRQGSCGGFRQYNQGGSGQGYHQQGYQGNQNGAPPIMWFNCGKDGHMARFCREFRGGYQRQQWGPPQNSEATSQAPAPANPAAPAHGTANIQGQRITEVPNVAAIELLTSAVGGVKVVRELVKYTDPTEVFAGERRQRSELTSKRESDTIRVRKRAMVNHPGSNDADPGGLSRSPALVERPDSDIKMEEWPQPTERTQKQKPPRQPKAPRRIRMMMRHASFDALAEFREMPVTNLKWGVSMDITPSLRRIVGTGLLF